MLHESCLLIMLIILKYLSRFYCWPLAHCSKSIWNRGDGALCILQSLLCASLLPNYFFSSFLLFLFPFRPLLHFPLLLPTAPSPPSFPSSFPFFSSCHSYLFNNTSVYLRKHSSRETLYDFPTVKDN